ncbi:hypothetical protein A2673_01970 [Candidatus Kaiserbacteria bacterium RIFCSPHIGHO2_01_FULL_50_13]|uniref:Uncharacterized protein n=1 Tax=Candidatus Kaiserbacteria bacterium RIFCSPLOWO2_01_FULL_50_24 TaxID=1798507 RepID=A0A1F6ER27_9BACT|nr:MAG: hypothetical protein A2673_01970 [Candidatus Kaiserbacteria bacterium RIFCSPHIGHO2_01_FULL_50_13]OGG76081.1 MAG: hypothetical protein A3A34_00575 [Candidatus Kaiserbacteria bacterium RIFCSPLOWO2_01_FULL_50_24]OGG81708.1 MAG: hypothetical protein A3H74_02875 [Candidatus Kaiserbacteria bacterium RIFCSPLOWO2_02_FULL_51_13]
MTTQVVFRVDPVIKKAAMRRAKREGVPFASMLKLATKAYAEGKFNVGIHVEEKFNAKTAREIRADLRDIEKGRNLSPAFSNVEDAIKWLNS